MDKPFIVCGFLGNTYTIAAADLTRMATNELNHFQKVEKHFFSSVAEQSLIWSVI
jgi:hypothetical protein